MRDVGGSGQFFLGRVSRGGYPDPVLYGGDLRYLFCKGKAGGSET